MKPQEEETFGYLKWQQKTDPPYYVNSTAISEDGGIVIAGTYFHDYSAPPTGPAPEHQFGTYCYNRDGTQLWLDSFTGFEGVYWVAVSADGSTAASGGAIAQTPYQGFIRAYDVATGSKPVLDARIGARVNQLALSQNGSTLVVGADNVYLFERSGGIFPAQPTTFSLPGENNSAQTIAVSADGSLFIVGDRLGNVFVIENAGGSIKTVYKWNNLSAITTIHSVAISSDGNWFAVVGSGSTVYLFSKSSFCSPAPAPTGTYYMDAGGRSGSVALSCDGSYISAVSNKADGGALYSLQNENGIPQFGWKATTPRNPNSTSMDADAKYVSVADGYPDGTPGHFILFERSSGQQLWSYPTPNMNWPMFISADGSGIVAGTDDGNVFYFTPQ